MEKHNTHIILDSNSSSRHDYEKDENGNIKIDVNEDLPYHSFIQKKEKISIKEILIENNNIFKKEFDKNVLSEEMRHKTQKKKKKKIITEDLFIKPEEYRFNLSKIQPCYNEVELKFNKHQKNEKNNLSYEIKEKNKKIEEDNSNDKNKKRNTMHLIDYKNKYYHNNDTNTNKSEQKGNNESKKKEKESSINSNYNYSEIIDKNNKNKQKKENKEVINTDKSSETILLRDKMQYQENESHNQYINNRYNKKEDIKITNESIPENIKDKTNSKYNSGINTNPEISKEKFLYENITKKTKNSISEDISNDKFLKDQKTSQKIEDKEGDINNKINIINPNENRNQEKEMEKSSNINKNKIINDDNKDDIKLLREILIYNENDELNKDNKEKSNIIEEINKENEDEIIKNKLNRHKDEIKNRCEDMSNSHINNTSNLDNNFPKNKETNQSQEINTTNKMNNPDELIITKKNSEKEKPNNISFNELRKDKISEISEKEKILKRNTMPYLFKGKNDNKNNNINEENNKNSNKKWNNNFNQDENIDIQNNNNEKKKNEENENLNKENKDNNEENKDIQLNSQSENVNDNANNNNSKENNNKNNDNNIIQDNKNNNQMENVDNLPTLLDKIQNSDNSYDISKNKLNENDINETNNITNKKSNGNTPYKIIESNGKNFNKNNLSNGQQNTKYNGEEYNDLNKINGKDLNKFDFYNQIDNNKRLINNIYNNNYNRTEKEETDEFLKNKSKGESPKKENNNRTSTEEFLENNLESQTNNKEKTIEVIKKEKTESDNKNDNSENSDNIGTKDEEKEEIILMRQIIPISYINKIRQKELKINKVIPKKKRVFISKLVNPHDLNETEEISLPIIPLCFMNNKYIIQQGKQIMKSINNKYFFFTKIKIKKEDEEKEKKLKKIMPIHKFPKVYKKTIVSPNKNSLFRTKTKGGKKYKSNSLLDINSGNSNLDINSQKIKKRIEKISLVSKDKDPNDIFNKKNKNILIKHNNNLVKELSDNLDNNNQIDISIQFSNKKPFGFLNNNNSNYKKLKKYPVSAKKKHKNLAEKLFKDLKDINSKLENKEEYFKKNFLNLHYDKHVGDEKTCPLCREMRKRGRKYEREKGLFNAFSFRNFKNLNRKSFTKLKISLQQKGRDKETDIWNNYERRNNNIDNNFFSMNNNMDLELKKKYMQFNGMNRCNRLNRYGSSENLTNYRYDNDKKSFRNLNLNMDREMEKNEDELDKIQYPALKNYFHDY